MNQLYIRSVRLEQAPPSDSYLASLPVVRHLSEQPLVFDSPVTFLMGENGSGKSTLIEALAVHQGFNPEGGTRNMMFSTADSHSGLWRLLRVSRGTLRPRDGFFLRAESYYNLASYLDKQEQELPGLLDRYGGDSLHEQSHGESFLATVENRFGGKGLYILDEPEAALSPARILQLMAQIHRLVQADSQFIIATHSPMLTALPGASVLEIREDGIRKVDWRQTEHYQILKEFLDRPERMLGYLLEE